jgi:simple sugar transport system ATP-binding protein
VTSGSEAFRQGTPIVEGRHLTKRFEGIEAIRDVSIAVYPGEVMCLLGDNGAGKSTLIKILSGVIRPTSGALYVDGKETTVVSPHHARSIGIATVHQTGGTIPLMSVGRNFFLGAEPTWKCGPLRFYDRKAANRVALEKTRALGLTRVSDGDQLVGSMSGGERQGLAIARALHFGARVLILDEPTSALGVKEAGTVLRLIGQACDSGIGVIFITHNANHALSVGDRFVVLIHGSVVAEFGRGDKNRSEVIALMAGGEEMESLEVELAKRFRDRERDQTWDS